MEKLNYAMTAEEFVVRLATWRQLWRRKTSAKAKAATRRHAKELARKHIRLFKQAHGLSKLPRMQGAFASDELWQQARAEDVKLVFPPRSDTLGEGFFEESKEARKQLRRVFRRSIEKNTWRRVDLVNAGNAANKRLPSLADATIGDIRATRGLFLEAVGAAIMPYLSAQDVEALEASGATVLDNEIIAVTDPLDAVDMAHTSSSYWHLEAIDAYAAHGRNLRGAGVTIGILDTGIDVSHPEFRGKSVHFQAFATNGSPLRAALPKDYESHGTHVAAICAGVSAGVAPDADLAVAAVLTERDTQGKMCGFLMQIAAGIDWLATHAGRNATGADIINASIGGSGNASEDYYQTILGHRLQGKLMIAAIGNDGRQGMGTHGIPGRFDCVLAVGASDVNDNMADFSAWGSTFDGNQPLAGYKPDLVAPGVDIYSALPKARYGRKSGTSMACPVVSGAAALLLQQDTKLRGDPDGLAARLLSLTKALPPGPHNQDERRYGRGRLHLADI